MLNVDMIAGFRMHSWTQYASVNVCSRDAGNRKRRMGLDPKLYMKKTLQQLADEQGVSRQAIWLHTEKGKAYQKAYLSIQTFIRR